MKGLILWDSSEKLYNPQNNVSMLHVEGRTDLVSAVSCGLHKYFGLVSHYNKESKIFIHNSDVIHCFLMDRDVSEEHLLRKIRAEKPVSCKFIRFPNSVSDLSEYLFNGKTINDILELIEKAEEKLVDNRSSNMLTAKQQISDDIQRVSELLKKELPELVWIVESLIVKGYILFSGKPKTGKSHLILQLALSIAMGINFLENFRVKKRKVLYLGLEDSEQRLQKRIFTILKKLEIDKSLIPEDLFYMTILPEQGDMMLNRLKTYIIEHEIEVLIIDTLKRLTSSMKKHGFNDSDRDYHLGMMMQDLSLRYGVSIVAVVHNRKSVNPEDVFENIAGTYGVQAAADTIMVLSKHKDMTKLSLTGRDIETDNLMLSFEDGIWTFLGNERELSAEKNKIRWEQYIPDGKIKSSVLINLLKEEFGIGRSSAFDWIKSAIDSKILIREKQGVIRLNGRMDSGLDGFENTFDKKIILKTIRKVQ